MIFLEVAQRITGRGLPQPPTLNWREPRHAVPQDQRSPKACKVGGGGTGELSTYVESHIPLAAQGCQSLAHGHHRFPQEPPRRSHHWLPPQGWIHSAGGGQRLGCWVNWPAPSGRVHRSGCRYGCRGCLPGQWPHYLRFSSSFLSAVEPRQPRLSPSELQHGPETEKHHPPRRVPSPGPLVSTCCRGGGCPASCHQVPAGD